MDDLSPTSQAIWPWSRDDAPDRAREARRRKVRAVLQAAVMSAFATLLALWLKKPIAAAALYTLAGIVVVGGFLVPALYEGFHRIVGLLVRGVGIAMTWLLLVPFFYICFTIGRIVAVVRGRDPLCMKCPTDEKTYWSDHGPPPKPEQYLRQY